MVFEMIRSEYNMMNRYISQEIAKRSVNLDKTDDDIDFLRSVFTLEEKMQPINKILFGVLNDYFGDLEEPSDEMMVGIKIVNNL
jgi:hypothetical protein